MTRLTAAALAVGLAAMSLVRPVRVAAQDTPVPGARPIALAEAIRLAQRNAPAAVQARGQETVNRAGVTSAYAAFIPNLTVNMGGVRQFSGAQLTRFDPTINAEVPIPQNPWTYSNGLGFNVNLFEGGTRFYDVRTARANVRSAEANTVTQQYAVSLNVQQQYYAVLAAHESEAAARAQLEEATQALRASSVQLAAGGATVSDSLRSVILVGNAQLALLTARNNLSNANASLTRLVASPTLVTASTSDTLDTPDAALDSVALARLSDQGPTVRESAAQLAAAEAGRKAARAPYLPTLSASYSRGGSGFDSRFGFGDERFNYQGSLRLGLSYPLFNQFAREEGVVRARVAEQNAEAALRDTRLAAQEQLAQSLSTLRTAEQQIAIQQASVAAASEDLRVQQQRYQLGASTLLDQLTSQTQLSQARAQLIQARYDARVARARIEAVIGQELR